MRKVNKVSLDFEILISVLILLVIGFLSIYASEYNPEESNFLLNTLFGKQIIWLSVAFIPMFLMFRIDRIFFSSFFFSFFLYFLSIAILILTFFIGNEVNGSKSWIDFGFIKVQPAEFAKIFTLLALSRYLSSNSFSFNKIARVFIACGIIILPVLCVVLQNDLGNAITFISFFFLFYRAGASGYLFILFFLAIGVSIATLLYSFPNVVMVLFYILGLRYSYMLIKRIKYFLVVFLISTLLLFLLIKLLPDQPYISYGLFLLTFGYFLFIRLAKPITKKWKHSVFPLLFLLFSFLSYFVNYGYNHFLKPYQKTRISILFGKEKHFEKDIKNLEIELKESRQKNKKLKIRKKINKLKEKIKQLNRGPLWNYNQSMIAYSSGGFLGKGFLNGTQNKFEFLPENSTDFIFCNVGEEWGFLGTSFTLLVYIFLLIRLVILSEKQRDIFAKYFGYGIASLLAVHVFINVGMTIGIFPVIGIPLPFISYGGSSLVTFLSLLAIFFNFNKADKVIFGKSK